ncbi:MAG: hypothetical protein AABX66_02575 [Nanoarchaeota archaeon]
MNSIETEIRIREFELFFARTPTIHGGACAKDQQGYPRDYVRSVPIRRLIIGTVTFDANGQVIEKPTERKDLVVEKYFIGVDGEMLVLQPNQEPPLSAKVKRGYNFEI